MIQNHRFSTTDYHRQNLVKNCRVSMGLDQSIQCPLCDAELTLRKRARHLERHMEDIALFVLSQQDSDADGCNDFDDISDSESSVVSDLQSEFGLHSEVAEYRDASERSLIASQGPSRPVQSPLIPPTPEVKREVLLEPEREREHQRLANSLEVESQNVRKLNEYFLPGDGISSEVILVDLCRYLGKEAVVCLGTYRGTKGYFYSAYRSLTTVRSFNFLSLSICDLETILLNNRFV